MTRADAGHVVSKHSLDALISNKVNTANFQVQSQYHIKAPEIFPSLPSVSHTDSFF